MGGGMEAELEAARTCRRQGFGGCRPKVLPHPPTAHHCNPTWHYVHGPMPAWTVVEVTTKDKWRSAEAMKGLSKKERQCRRQCWLNL